MGKKRFIIIGCVACFLGSSHLRGNTHASEEGWNSSSSISERESSPTTQQDDSEAFTNSLKEIEQSYREFFPDEEDDKPNGETAKGAEQQTGKEKRSPSSDSVQQLDKKLTTAIQQLEERLKAEPNAQKRKEAEETLKALKEKQAKLAVLKGNLERTPSEINRLTNAATAQKNNAANETLNQIANLTTPSSSSSDSKAPLQTPKPQETPKIQNPETQAKKEREENTKITNPSEKRTDSKNAGTLPSSLKTGAPPSPPFLTAQRQNNTETSSSPAIPQVTTMRKSNVMVTAPSPSATQEPSQTFNSPISTNIEIARNTTSAPTQATTSNRQNASQDSPVAEREANATPFPSQNSTPATQQGPKPELYQSKTSQNTAGSSRSESESSPTPTQTTILSSSAEIRSLASFAGSSSSFENRSTSKEDSNTLSGENTFSPFPSQTRKSFSDSQNSLGNSSNNGSQNSAETPNNPQKRLLAPESETLSANSPEAPSKSPDSLNPSRSNDYSTFSEKAFAQRLPNDDQKSSDAVAHSLSLSAQQVTELTKKTDALLVLLSPSVPPHSPAPPQKETAQTTRPETPPTSRQSDLRTFRIGLSTP